MDISIWIEANFNFLLDSFGFVPSIVDYTTLMFEIYFCFKYLLSQYLSIFLLSFKVLIIVYTCWFIIFQIDFNW